MVNKESKLLSEAHKQFPLGVTIEDYSSVKREVDRLRKEGVEDLGRYLTENPDVLSDLARSIQVISANDRMLRLFQINTLDEYIAINSEFMSTTLWGDSYIQEFESLARTGSYNGDYLDSKADGLLIYFRTKSWIQTGHEDGWSLVVTTYEDISETVETAKALRERDVQIEQALGMAQMGTWVWDGRNNEYEYVSPQLAEIFGYDVDEFLDVAKKPIPICSAFIPMT